MNVRHGAGGDVAGGAGTQGQVFVGLFFLFSLFFFLFLPLKAPRWARYEPNSTGSSQEWFSGHSPSSSWSGTMPTRRHTAAETPRAGGLGAASVGGDGSIPPSSTSTQGPPLPVLPVWFSSCSHHAAATQMSPLPPLSPPACSHLLLSEVKVSLVPWGTSAPRALPWWGGPPRREGAHLPWHMVALTPALTLREELEGHRESSPCTALASSTTNVGSGWLLPGPRGW